MIMEMEKCVIDDCNGINGIPLFGIWDVKEGFAKKIESTFIACSHDIDYPIEEKTSKIFDPFIYYSFILVERREKEVKHNAFEILNFLYESFPLSERARRYGKVESYTLFYELIEDIMTLISEHYIESPSNKFHDNFYYVIGKLDEWARTNLDVETLVPLLEERHQAKVKAWEESQKSKDVAGEHTAPKTADVSTKKTHRKPRKEKSFRDIIQYEDKDKLLERLHYLIDGKGGASVGAVLFKAWHECHFLMKKPTRAEYESEFKLIGSWSAIKNYMNDNNQNAYDKAMMIDIFE